MGHYNHSIPVDANIMVSINCPIIGEQVAVTPLNFQKFKVALNGILGKYFKIIDNFSFDKGATVVANKKDHFIYS